MRYSSGAEQTKYTYAGQYSYASDFGLMFYNARWYDTSLGRFTQADSIIPAGVQGYDRYAAMNNNPVRYTDPSGHRACVTQAECEDMGTTPGGSSGEDKDDDSASDMSGLILICGFYTGENCDVNSDLYDGRPLKPYLSLSSSSDDPSMYRGFPGNEGKLAMAKAIYDLIVSYPEKNYNIVGHSAGGSAVILAVEQLIQDGRADQIKNLILLDPYFDSSLKSIDGKRDLNLQDVANSFSSNGISIFLGDSPTDGRDSVVGAVEFHTAEILNYPVDHTHLATNLDIFSDILSNSEWRP